MHRSPTLMTFSLGDPLDILQRIMAQFLIAPPNNEASGAIWQDYRSMNEGTNLLGDCYLLA